MIGLITGKGKSSLLSKVFCACLLLNISSLIKVNGQDSTSNSKSPWKLGGEFGLTTTLVTLTNWASGGGNTVSVNGALGLFADAENRRQSWENTLNVAYGVVRDNRSTLFQKSDDNITLETKYGYQVIKENSQWYFSGIANFKTQLYKGYATLRPDSVISGFLSPGVLVVGLGIDFKQKDVLSLNYVPLSGKYTVLKDPQLSEIGAYGVLPGEKFRMEMGTAFIAEYEGEVFNSIDVESKMELFTNYEENFGDIDLNWLNTIEVNLNRWILLRYTFHLIYDADIKVEIDENSDGVVDLIGPKVQTKSIMGIGISLGIGDERKK